MCTIIYRFVIIVIPLIRTHVHVKAKSSNSPPFSNVRYRKYNVDIAAKIGESNRNSLHKQPSFLIEEIHVKKKKKTFVVKFFCNETQDTLAVEQPRRFKIHLRKRTNPRTFAPGVWRILLKRLKPDYSLNFVIPVKRKIMRPADELI